MDTNPEARIFFASASNFLTSANNIVTSLTIAISAIALSGTLGFILWDIATQYLVRVLTRQSLTTTLLLTVVIDPHTLSIAICWLRYAFTKEYKPTYDGPYWRPITYLRQRLLERTSKFVVIFALVRWFDISLSINIGYFLRMIVDGVFLFTVVSYTLKLGPFISVVFREILLKLAETAVAIVRQSVTLRHILGRNMSVMVLMFFAYLALSGTLTSVLSDSAYEILNKTLLTASGIVMGVADVLFDITDDRIVYKGVVIRYP